MQFFTNLDANIFFFLNSFSGDLVVNFIIVFLAEYLPYVLIVLFPILLYRSNLIDTFQKKFLIACAVYIPGLIARFGVTELIRVFYERPRPFVLYDLKPLFHETSFSFPSGHASFFFAFAFAIYLYDKKFGMWFFVATIIMTAARVVAGVHYPSDILGGMVVGIVVAHLTHKYFAPLINRLIHKLPHIS